MARTRFDAGLLLPRFERKRPEGTKVDEASRVLQPLLPGARPTADLRMPLAPLPAALDAAPLLARAHFAAPPGATGRARRTAAAALELPEAVGALKIADRAAFERLARRDDVPGAPQVREVKFLLVDADTDPKLYLINTKNFEYHWDFATRGLGKRDTLEEFNAKTYFTDNRTNVAGSLVLHESYEGRGGKKGLFALEFWPTDQVRAKHVAQVFKAMKKAMPWAAGQLAYHPAGDTQEALYAKEAAALKQLRVKTILSKDLFANITYAPMNLGEGYGYLRVIDPAQPQARPPTARDIVIFENTPNDLSHVGGIITENPQTPLSHINLKAKQNHTPNAYVKNASEDPRIEPFLRDPPALVRYEVGPDGLQIREATREEADAFFDRIRPPAPQVPRRDLRVKHVTALSDVRFEDAGAFGAKAANVAELGRILPRGVVPDGYAVPFHFYDRFMKHNGLYDEVKRLLADPAFHEDAAVREEALKKLRKKIKDAEMPAALSAELGRIQEALLERLGPGAGIRCRSSTNNEDLPGFNGAGLYDSYTHRADEGHLEKTIKQVFASMWNFRAFEERDFYRVDHLKAAMGVLLHENEDDEVANGVAYTKNIYDPNWPGFYVNAQVGEQLVTNPERGVTPDEFLISRIGANGEYETQYIAHSNQTEDGKTVLTRPHIDELVSALEVVQAHFKRRYGREGDKTFAMDVELKIRHDGTLQIKQARPVVD